MTPLQRELKKMGINPKEWDKVLTDEDIIDIDCIEYEWDDSEEE